MDPSVVRTFEEFDSLYTCERLLRQLVPFNAWPLWTLHNFIRARWEVCSAPRTFNALHRGEQAVLVKVAAFCRPGSANRHCWQGTFELDGRREAVTRGQLCDGPVERLTALAGPVERCFFLGLYRQELGGDVQPTSAAAAGQRFGTSSRVAY